MRKNIISELILAALLISILMSAFHVQSAEASPGTITIKADGSIDPLTAPISTADKITYAFTGNADESIVVERDNIVVDGAGYTVQGTGNGTGINLSERSNVTIKNMRIKTFFNDVYLNSSSNCVIYGNNITNGNTGIRIDSSSGNNSINYNNVANNQNGIYLGYSSNNSLRHNNITSNNQMGVEVGSSSNNSLVGNNVTTNGQYGFWLHSSPYNNICGNKVIENGLVLIKSDGILLVNSSGNTVSDNTVTDNGGGISLSMGSSGNFIKGNSIAGNNGIYNGRYGVHVYYSSGNTFFHNNIINNTGQVLSYESTNVWDNGYPLGGNYWSDYSGIDQKSGPCQNVTGNDGIGDTLYAINTNNTDRYPLMHPWSSLPVHNINTGFGYSTIQGGVDASQTLNGHVIFVDEGIYYGSVLISKAVMLIGTNQEGTIIDGKGQGIAVLIAANNVHVTNMNLRNRNYGIGISGSTVVNASVENCTISNFTWGIWFDSSSSISISHNTISNVMYMGIVGYASSNVTIENNLVDAAGLAGIHLDENSVDSKILNNTVTNSLEGIEIEKSAGNFVEGNRLINSNASLVINQGSGPNIFRRNNMTSHEYNLIVWGWSLVAFNQDIDTSNTVNNKTIYYLTNLHNRTISPSDYPNIGYLALVNSTNVKVKNIDFSFNRDGILLAQSSNCSLVNVTLSGNRGSFLNGGLTFFKSNNNTVINSMISNNSAGACFYQSNANTFYHNSFINNTRQVVSNLYSPFSPPSSYYSANTWDNGFEGNYWSNYTGVYNLTTGIGLTPHIIDETNQDNYPMMTPYIPGDFNHDGAVNMDDANMTRQAWQSATGDFNYNAHVDTNLDGIVNISDAVIIGLNWQKHV